MVQNLLWGTEEHLIRGLNIMLVLFNVIFYTNNEFLQYMCVKKTSLKYISLYYLIWFQGKTVLYNYYQLLIINVSYIFQTKNWYNNPLSKYITASLSTRLNIDHKYEQSIWSSLGFVQVSDVSHGPLVSWCHHIRKIIHSVI